MTELGIFLNKVRLLLLVLILAGFLVLFGLTYFGNPLQAGTTDQYGAEFSVGIDHPSVAIGSENYDFRWLSATIFRQKQFNDNWYGRLEGALGYLKWSSKSHNDNYDTFSIGALIVAYRHIYGPFSVGIGAGFTTLTDGGGLPDLGNSGLYGTFTGRIKMEVSEKCGMEFAADHISDAFQNGDEGDAGKNVMALKLYYMFD
jgi:hypothetical protein